MVSKYPLCYGLIRKIALGIKSSTDIVASVRAKVSQYQCGLWCAP